ncbi:MAG: hypothetical protein IH791_00990 [Thaumarchaeota archaeon]|nr:hypothetical protein [Nitrososphaerota archaeon]
MVLDKEFQVKITSLIDECLIPHGIQTHECNKEFWNYRSDDDFKFGHKAGVILGIILGYYIAKYGKVPSGEDLSEMTEMVESRRDEIKKSFADIRFSYKV